MKTIIGLAFAVFVGMGCLAAKDLVHPEQGGSGNQMGVQDLMHPEQIGEDSDLADVDIPVTAEIDGIDQGADAQGGSASSRADNGTAWTISPTISIRGSDAVAVIGLLALAVMWIWGRRNRKSLASALRVMVRSIEAMPADVSRPVKARVEREAYRSRVSQVIYDAVQREVKQVLKADQEAVNRPSDTPGN